MTALIDPKKYTKTLDLLRSFFLARNFLEVHTQNRLSILAACEDPETVATYEYNGEVWPLPQTGQMWLEYELLKNPDVAGFFCLSTSYRAEPNPVEGRHEVIFPMFEFEMHGGVDDLKQMEIDLCKHMGLPPLVERTYDAWCDHFNTKELDHDHERQIGSGMITDFPEWTSPFWNMSRFPEPSGTSKKIDVILGGMETIGSAERSTNVDEMRDTFHTISDGGYAALLYRKFGKERVEAELDEFLNFDFFPRSGGGIGMQRLMSALS